MGNGARGSPLVDLVSGSGRDDLIATLRTGASYSCLIETPGSPKRMVLWRSGEILPAVSSHRASSSAWRRRPV